MKINIDNKVLNDYGLNFYEYIYLLVCENIKDIQSSLLDKKLINDENEIIEEKLKKHIQSTKRVRTKNFVIPTRLYELADKLIVLYPKGLKPNTNITWRGSRIEIASKLVCLEELYGIVIEEDNAITATKKYVQSFSNDKTLMQTLKYFILKQVCKDGLTEYKSELLAFIDMVKSGTEIQQQNDWIGELK